VTGLLDLALDALDAVFEALKDDLERYIRRYWWRFVERQPSGGQAEPPCRRVAAVRPPFWGHRTPLGGDER